MGKLGGVGACRTPLRLALIGLGGLSAVALVPCGPLSPAAAPAFAAEYLVEGFEDAFPPAGWTEIENAPEPHNWHASTDPTYVHSGSAGALVVWTDTRMQDEKLASPLLDLSGADPDSLTLSFWWRGTLFFADIAELQVHGSTDGVTWDPLWQMSDLVGAATGVADAPGLRLDPWQEAVVDLSAYAGGNLSVRFRYKGRGGTDIAVDDIRVGSYEPPVPPENDTCLGAVGGGFLLGPGTFDVSGNNNLAAMDYPLSSPGSCTGYTHTGRDLVWVVDLDEGMALRVTMTTAGDWDDTLFLIEDCADPQGTCVAGSNAIPDGSTLTHANPGPGTRRYYLVASAYAQGVGDFALTGWVAPIGTVTNRSWGRVKASYR